jgi:transposase
MDKVNRRCAGLDVHKDSVWACARVDGGGRHTERFGSTSRELLRLGDWLASHGVTVVAMESTGVFWKPVWNLLEGRVDELMLVNARHVKQVPGRKTDVTDCQWIAQLLEHGLLKSSFVPPRPRRELRDLTRQRTQLLGDRARVVNRVHKTLEDANIKLAGVATDVMGKSGRAILDALVEGKLTAAQMAELAHKRMEAKKPLLREALLGRVTDHHRFMLRQLLDQVDALDRLVAAFDARVEAVMSPLEREAVTRLDTVPGFDVRTGQNVIAEVGTDMTRFPSPHHLASWAGMCPGNDRSAGKRKGGRTRQANRPLAQGRADPGRLGREPDPAELLQRPAPTAHDAPRCQTRDGRGGPQPAGDGALPAVAARRAVRGPGRRLLRRAAQPRAAGRAHGPQAPAHGVHRRTQTPGGLTFSEQEACRRGISEE